MEAPAPATLRGVLREARNKIEALGSEEAALEAELLLMHALGIDRAKLYQRFNEALTDEEAVAFQAMVSRRLAHEPVPYITGRREFFGLDFAVAPAVLIPRPETETLVELALAFARSRPATSLTIADIGVGAGTIAISLAVHLPPAAIIATDVSQDALVLARRNAQRHGVAECIDIRLGDLLAPLNEPIDIIAANPPYVTTVQWEAMPPEIREHEPRVALDGGADGLDVVRRLLMQAPHHLGAGGALFCEIADWQGEAARAQAAGAFPRAHIEVCSDLAGRDRVLAVYP